MEEELKKLNEIQAARMEALKLYADKNNIVSLDWVMKNILGWNEEDLERIKNPFKIKKVRDWKKNN